MQNWMVIIALCLTIASQQQRSFVDTAPVSEVQVTREGILPPITNTSLLSHDTSEQELENLKSIGQLGKTLDLIKSRSSVYANVNGEKEAHSETREEVKENGEMVAKVSQHTDTTFKEEIPHTKVKTEIDIPSEGIHKTDVQLQPDFETVQKHVNRRSPLNLNILADNENSVMDKLDSSSGIQYSPLDVAEYVFWTGDEKGVTLAIEEFLQEGLMTREEAITFLQEIKYNLDNLKSHYTQLGLNSLQRSKIQEGGQKHIEFPGRTHVSFEKPELRSNFDIKQLRQEADKKRTPQTSVDAAQLASFEKANVGSDENSEEEYDQLLERLRIADFLYTEYSLEEVIYQLAKLMFTQSLTRGSAEAQQALQKFTNFLEAEAAQGHISRALEKKVLDVLIASLTDTLSEHPELLASAKENLGPTPGNVESQNFIRQILDANLDEKATARDYFAYKEQSKNHRVPKLITNKMGHLAFDFSKYKNS